MNKIRVLLVDDESDFLEVMGARIRRWGYEAIAATNGKEAIAAVKSKECDIIILDYFMPGMDGMATLTEIRKIDKEIPVIMFTAYPDTKVIEGTEKLGVYGFIPKLSAYQDTQAILRSAISILEKKIG